MSLSSAGVVRTALASLAFTLLLVFLLAAVANALGSAGVPVEAVQVAGFVLASLARIYAGVLGGRAARRADLSVAGAVLTGTVGCAVGYIAFELLNSVTEVVLLARELTFGWSMLYGILLWLPAGAIGGYLGGRRKARRR
ncbi:MAG: hypothetical protein GEV10_15150 [Streptosporangiales bacterium]|nr:hypothetical protein [Streptosporangiales bacterium]